MGLLKPGGELAYFEYAGVRVMKAPLVAQKAARTSARSAAPIKPSSANTPAPANWSSPTSLPPSPSVSPAARSSPRHCFRVSSNEVCSSTGSPFFSDRHSCRM